MFSKKSEEVREMASLTKIMTAITSIEIACELKINIHKLWFIVSKYASTMIGTTAGLVEQQRVTIFDLLHGLMLPSGNDAAMTLAENFSERLRELKKRGDGKVVQDGRKTFSPFVKRMNKLAFKLHLRNTNYTNPHGLADKANHSTAYELA